MRFFGRFLLACAGCLFWISTAPAAPVSATLSVRGEFDPGTSNATASNSDLYSTLSIATSTLSYGAATVSVALKPGDSMPVELGDLVTSSGELQPIPFDGAVLKLAVTLEDPTGVPSLFLLQGVIAGKIGDGGGAVTVTWQPPVDLSFTTLGCVSKLLTVTLDPAVTTVMNGDPPSPVLGTLSVDYASPMELGDVDGDGVISMADAVKALQYAGGLDESQCEDWERGDINGDGVLDALDAVSLLRKLNSLF